MKLDLGEKVDLGGGRRDAPGDSLGDSLRANLRPNPGVPGIRHNLWLGFCGSLRVSVEDSLRASLRDSLRASLRDSLRGRA